MKVLSLLAAGGLGGRRPARVTALNNTGLFGRQAIAHGQLALAALLAATACARRGPEGGGARDQAAANARRDARERAPGGAGEEVWAEGPPEVPACPTPPPGVAARAGGVLRVHLEAAPPHLNPLLDSLEVVDRVTRGLIYEPVLECGQRGYQPALAERWELEAEGTRLILHLRPAVSWHDGRALTAIDVQASLESVLRSSSRLGVTRAGLADVAAVEVLSDRAVRLRLHRPSAFVLPALCEVPIVPARLVRGTAAEKARLQRAPVGTGPFRFGAWERGRQIRLEANRAGWRGPPALRGINFEIEEDGVQALQRARRGELDVLARLAEAHVPEQIRAPVLVAGRLRPLQVPDGRATFVAINHRQPALAEAPVRQALARICNRARLATELHKGLARVQGPAALAGAPAPAFDPALAARLLDAAGYRDADRDGIRERAGQPLAFTLLYADPGPAAGPAAQRLADQAIRLGIRLEPTPAAPQLLADRLRAGKFDLALVAWHGRPREDPRPLLSRTGAYNSGAFHSPRIDGLLDRLVAAVDPGAREGLWAQLGGAAAEEVPALFLYSHQRVLLLGTAVQGVCHDGTGLDLRGAWLQPPPAPAPGAP
jgi:peptide/nickel transport system substrate-binding protein